jgi:hypothetical protein
MSMFPSMYRIAVDLDNVYFDTDAYWRKVYQEQFSTQPTRRLDILWNGPLYDTHFESYPEWLAWLAEHDVWNSIPEIEGANQGVRQLVDYGFDVWFMTARTDHAAQATREWWHDSEFANKTTLATDMHVKTEQEAQAYIDDRPKTLLQIDQETDALPICFLQPWNDSAQKWQDDCGDFEVVAPSAKVRPVRTWYQVVDVIIEDYRLNYET